MSPHTDTHSPTPARWFPVSAITGLVDSLDDEIARIDEKCRSGDVPPEPTDADDVQRWTKIAVVCAVVLVALVMGMIVLGRTFNPNHQITARGIGSLAVAALFLVVLGYFGFGHTFAVRGSRLKRRRQALREFAASAGSLSSGRALPVSGESVGRLPWLATELDHVIECDLYGKYRGHRLAVLRCAYVVDKSLTALEDTVGKFASAVMSHVQHEGVRRQELEAIVFMDPVARLPDVFCGAKKQPLNWYFKRALHSQNLNVMTSESRWIATSDVECFQECFGPAAQRLFSSRPNAILQVMGGYVVLLPQSWDWSRPEMAQEAGQLKGHLEWVCALYESLDTSSAPEAAPSDVVPPAAESPTAESVAQVATEPLPKAQVDPLPVRKPDVGKPRSALQVLAALCGVVCFLVGGIFSLAIIVYAIQAKSAAAWPTIEGRVVESTVDVRAGRTPMFSAHVEYDFTVEGRGYHGDRLAIGPPERDRQRANIEAVLAQYPINQPVTVYYNPNNPTHAVLEPRLANAGISLGVGIFFALLTVFGIYLIYRGVRRPRTV